MNGFKDTDSPRKLSILFSIYISKIADPSILTEVKLSIQIPDFRLQIILDNIQASDFII